MKAATLLVAALLGGGYLLCFGANAKMVPFIIGLGVAVSWLQRGLPAGTGDGDDGYAYKVRNIVALAVIARLTLALVIDACGIAEFFAPDTVGYHGAGLYIVDYLRGALATDLFQQYSEGYNVNTYFVGALYYLFGPEPLIPTIINCFVGGSLAWLAYLVGLEIGLSKRQAYLACVLVAFWPSLILWSSLMIRDSWMHFLVMACILLWDRMVRRRASLGSVALLLAALALIGNLRGYLLPIMLAAFAISWITARSRHKGLTLMLIVGLFLFAIQFDQIGGVSLLQAANQIQTIRSGFAQGAVGSAFATDATLNTPGDVLAFIPRAMLYFLFAPFPWDIRSALQATTLLEVLVFYGCFYFIVRGIIAQMRTNFVQTFTPLLVTLMIAVAYAITEGNVGTIYRHKAQILPLLLIFLPKGYEAHRQAQAARTSAWRRRRALPVKPPEPEVPCPRNS